MEEFSRARRHVLETKNDVEIRKQSKTFQGGILKLCDIIHGKPIC